MVWRARGIWLSTAQVAGLKGRKRQKDQMGRVGCAAVLRGGLKWREGVKGLEMRTGRGKKCRREALYLGEDDAVRGVVVI